MTHSNGNHDDELETIRQLLIATANRTENNSNSINRLTDQVDHFVNRVDQIAVAQQNTEASLNQVAIAQRNTEASLNQLAALVVQFIENAQADRAVIREIQTEVRGLQTENRKILEYLFGQHPNGNGDQPQA